MPRQSLVERDEVASRIFAELGALHTIIEPLPNIVGPAYGARMCDRAGDVLRAVERLLIGLNMALSSEAWERANLPWKDRTPGAPSITERDTLRVRAGLPPDPEMRLAGQRFRLPPLDFQEHLCLGNDLKRLHRVLVQAECDLGNTFGGQKRNGDLSRRAAKATRKLLSLRSVLDSLVVAEFPAREPCRVYFGAELLVGMVDMVGQF